MTWKSDVPLRTIAEVALGRQRSPQHDQGPHMVKYLRAANVKDGQLDLADVKFMNFTPMEQQVFGLKPGDILVTEGSGSLTAIGASAAWPEVVGKTETYCFQNTLLRLRPRTETTDGRFLFWWAQSAYGSGLFASLAGGANIYHLSADRVRAVRLDVPKLDMQRRIADFLDAETNRIDTLVNVRVSQRCTLAERTYSVVSDRLLPGILSTPKGQMPWPWLPDLSTDRPLVRLGYVCRIQNGITIDSGRNVVGDAITRPYLRVANVQAGYVALDSVTEVTVRKDMAKASTLRPGDVLMTEGGDLDKLGRGTVWRGELPGCLHQNHVFALRPDTTRLNADYLALMTQTLHGRCYFESTGSKTTNLASTNSSKILSFPVPLPPLQTQVRLVAEVQNSLDILGRTTARLDTQLRLLGERRQALITAAVTGQIDVSTASGRGIED